MKKKILSLILVFLFLGCEGKKEKTVNIYMWGGSKEINLFMDNVVAPEIKINTGIILNRVPLTDIRDTVNKLIIEKEAKRKNGTLDILWVNGENFKHLKEANVLIPNMIKNLENISLVNPSTLEKDFGEPILGMEAPWGEAQFNFIYNTLNSNNNTLPFYDSASLLEYVKNNPGKFTYPSTTNFTGSAFVRNIAIDIIGLENIEKMSTVELKTALEPVWKYFRTLKPFLWRKGDTYPESEGKLDELYSNGEINISMGYTISKVVSKIEAGQYPQSSKSFLLKNGTLFNNHYLTIPANAKNKNEALIVINQLLSPKMQLLKQDPKNWGDFTILSLDMLSQTEKESFKNLSQNDKVVPLNELKSKRVRELSPEKTLIIEEGWYENVGKR